MRCEEIKNTEDMEFVVPGKTLSEILKLLSDEDTPASLVAGRRHIVMEIGGYAVISRLLDGEFLPYEKAIPQQTTTTIHVGTRTLVDAVDRTSLVINDRLNPADLPVPGQPDPRLLHHPLGKRQRRHRRENRGQ